MTQFEFEDQAYIVNETPDPAIWDKLVELVELGVDLDAHMHWALREVAEELIRIDKGGVRQNLTGAPEMILNSLGL